MWLCVVLFLCVVDNLCFWYCIELLFVFHEVTDALAKVADLNAGIPQEGFAYTLSNDHDCLWIHFRERDFHGKP